MGLGLGRKRWLPRGQALLQTESIGSIGTFVMRIGSRGTLSVILSDYATRGLGLGVPTSLCGVLTFSAWRPSPSVACRVRRRVRRPPAFPPPPLSTLLPPPPASWPPSTLLAGAAFGGPRHPRARLARAAFGAFAIGTKAGAAFGPLSTPSFRTSSKRTIWCTARFGTPSIAGAASPFLLAGTAFGDPLPPRVRFR